MRNSGYKSVVSSLGYFESIKDEIRFECSSVFSISEFSTAKEPAKILKKEGTHVNTKGEEGGSRLECE